MGDFHKWGQLLGVLKAIAQTFELIKNLMV